MHKAQVCNRIHRGGLGHTSAIIKSITIAIHSSTIRPNIETFGNLTFMNFLPG